MSAEYYEERASEEASRWRPASERWQRLMRQAEARGIEVDDALSEALAAAALAVEQARLTMDDYPRGCPFLARRLPCPSWTGRSCLRSCDVPF